MEQFLDFANRMRSLSWGADGGGGGVGRFFLGFYTLLVGTLGFKYFVENIYNLTLDFINDGNLFVYAVLMVFKVLPLFFASLFGLLVFSGIIFKPKKLHPYHESDAVFVFSALSGKYSTYNRLFKTSRSEFKKHYEETLALRHKEDKNQK